MKKSKSTESQVIFALRQTKTGARDLTICCKMGISEATFYSWKKRGIDVSELRCLRQMEQENCWLKKLVADLSLD